MAKRTYKNEFELLEQSRIALDNAQKQPQISTQLAAVGYTPEVIAEGVKVLSQTQNAYNQNKKEDDETSASHTLFVEKKAQLEDVYMNHRKKAKVVFRQDPEAVKVLMISGTRPVSYARLLEVSENFYQETSVNAELQTKLARLGLKKKDFIDGGKLLNEVKQARSEYLREIGESQDATIVKDKAFSNLEYWMSDFYAVARIALEDNPQLLEALGKIVKR